MRIVSVATSATVIMFLVTGCGRVFSALDPRPRQYASPARSDNSGVPIHGYFCGPGYPGLTGKTKEERVQELEAISPFDDVDAACKRHDICYERDGFGSRACDGALHRDLKRLQLNIRCSGLRARLGLYFWLLAPAVPGTARDVPTKQRMLDFITLPWKFWAGLPGAAMTIFHYPSADRWEICNNAT